MEWVIRPTTGFNLEKNSYCTKPLQFQNLPMTWANFNYLICAPSPTKYYNTMFFENFNSFVLTALETIDIFSKWFVQTTLPWSFLIEGNCGQCGILRGCLLTFNSFTRCYWKNSSLKVLVVQSHFWDFITNWISR